MKLQKQNSRELQSVSKEVEMLQKELGSFQQENTKIYQKIMKLDEQFTFSLYKPVDHQGVESTFLKPLLLRQIDKLMEEKEILVKKLEMLKFIEIEEKSKRENELSMGNKNHYAFLRSAWGRWGNGGVDSGEKIENMNKIINNIRNNIKYMIVNENESINKELQVSFVPNSYMEERMGERERESKERILMRNEELEMLCYEYQDKIAKQNEMIDCLESKLCSAQKQIEKFFETFNMNNQKIETLQNDKMELEKQLENSHILEQSYEIVHIGKCEQFKIKIESNFIEQREILSTYKSLQEILNFIAERPNSQVTTELLNPELQLQIPDLKLGSTLSTNEATLTDRYLPRHEKFIPIRAERSLAKRVTRLKTSNNESIGEMHENLDLTNVILKRFSRKIEYPLTSDRARKNEIGQSELMND